MTITFEISQLPDDLRDDVAPDELSSYCLHALTAASSLPSKAAVSRLVTVILARLHPPRRLVPMALEPEALLNARCEIANRDLAQVLLDYSRGAPPVEAGLPNLLFSTGALADEV